MPLYGKNILEYMFESVLNEAYIGKTPTLLKIEEEFQKFRDENHKMTESNSTNPHIIAINRLFEEQFGMNLFALKILPTNMFNGYTCTLGTRIDIARDVDLPNMVEGNMTSGFRYKEGNDFVILVYISYGMLTHVKITPAMLVGVILHEIGHNFADCLYGDINFANKDLMRQYEQWLIEHGVNMGMLKAILTGRYFYWRQLQKIKSQLNNEDLKKKEEEFNKSSGKSSNKLRGLAAGLAGKVKDWSYIRRLVKAKLKGKANIEKYKRMEGSYSKNKNKNSLRRQNEVIADKFAGIYGYGPEIAASLAVMDLTPNAADEKIAKMSKRAQKAAAEYDEAYREINDFDEHPQLVQRIHEEIKLLSREIEKDDIDPKVKKVIQDQLQELQDMLDEVTKSRKELSESENGARAYNDYVNQNCPDAVSEDIEDKIEEALDKLLEESKKKSKTKKNK